MKVSDYADKKKKLLFGPLSWPTELPTLGYVPKNKPLNDSRATVPGSDAEFIKELIASGLLGSAEAPNSGTDGHARSPGFCAHGKCRTARLSQRSLSKW